jgi:hypothetical protein
VSSSSDSASISSIGQLFSQLQSLQTSNPTQFKQLMTNAANQLQAAATQAGASTPEGQALTSMSQKFQDVANGGSLSELQQGHHGHHHHHGSVGTQGTYDQSGQVSGSQSTSASTGSTSSTVAQVMQSVFSSLEQALQ